MLQQLIKQLDDPSPEKRRAAREALTAFLKNIEIVTFSCEISVATPDPTKDKKLGLSKVRLAVNTEMDIYHQIDTHVAVVYKATKFLKIPVIND